MKRFKNLSHTILVFSGVLASFLWVKAQGFVFPEIMLPFIDVSKNVEEFSAKLIFTNEDESVVLNENFVVDTDGDGVPDIIDIDDDNDGVLDTEECDFSGLTGTDFVKIKERIIVSSYHGTMIRLLDGNYVVSGDNASPTGADIITPLKLIPANGYNYTGTLIDVAAAGYPSQYAILTTDGLWAWGSRGHLLPTGLTSSSQFQKITLPTAVVPSDVSVIDAGEEVMAMLMKNGEVFVASSRTGNHNGGGTSTLSPNFTKVMLDATTPLTGITDIQVSVNGIFAYNASTNKFYTWGIQTYLGDASANATRSFATEMVNPLPIGVKAKQIELSTDETTGTSYYVLGTDQKIYVLGANTEGQLGLGNSTAALSWGIVKNQAGTADLTGVSFISASHAYTRYPGISAILINKRVLSWGQSSNDMLGNGGSFSLPTALVGPMATTDVAIVENGSHFSSIIKDVNPNNEIANVGHNYAGAFADGTTTDRSQFESNPIIGGHVIGNGIACNADIDGDGIPNSLDLDSDGDGCSDANEAGSSTTATSLFNYPVGPDSNGNGLLDIYEGTSDGTINYTSQYAARATDNTIKFCTDTDGDGIPDQIDLDDDNDGVLDTDECINFFAQTFPTSGGKTDVLTGWAVAGTYNSSSTNWSSGGRIHLVTNGLEFRRDANTISTITKTFTNLPAKSAITLSNIYWYNTNGTGSAVVGTLNVKLNGVTYATVKTGTLQTSAPTITVANGAKSNLTALPSTATETTSAKSNLIISLPNEALASATLLIEFVASSSSGEVDDMGFRAISINSCSPDTDGDGKINSLDLDSDNDGCSDAIEAGSSATATNTSVFPTGTDTNSNGLLNDYESTTTAGAINYSSTYSLFALNNTINVCTDTDGDGIRDLFDLDDDNDGVLDEVEYASCLTEPTITMQNISGSSTGVLGYNSSFPTWMKYSFDEREAGYKLIFSKPVSDIVFEFASVYNLGEQIGNFTVKMSDGTVYSGLDFDLSTSHPFTDAIWTPQPDGVNNFNGNLMKGFGTPFASGVPYFKTISTTAQGWGIVALKGIPNASIIGISEVRFSIAGGPTTTTGITGGLAVFARAVPTMACINGVDTDGDGKPNHLDLDSDGDGCSDAIEAGSSTTATNTSVFPTGTDTNSNGLLNDYESTTIAGTINYTSTYTNYALSNTLNACTDTDGDGVRDVIDLDDDNDGILDVTECEIPPYKVYTYNRPSTSWSTSVPVAITGATVQNITLDQQTAATGADSYTFNSVSGWKLLSTGVGLKPDANNKITVRITPSGGSFLVADAMLISNGINTYIIDDNPTSTSEFVMTGANWTPQASTSAYAEDNMYIASANYSGRAATWIFNIPAISCLDTDGDGLINSLDLDSDNDGCSDANEAYGLASAQGTDGNMYYGTGNPPAVNADGTVIAANYLGTNANVSSAGSASTITTQPIDNSLAEGVTTTTFSAVTTAGSGTTSYQWQLSTDNGTNWTNVSDDSMYSGATTATLTLTGIVSSMNGYKYRLNIAQSDFVCGNLTSNEARLILASSPSIIDEEFTGSGGLPLSGNVLTNDTGSGSPASTLTVSGYSIADISETFNPGTSASIPNVGSILINTDGSFTFTPVANYNGTVPVITYTVSDGNGGTGTGDLVITVTAVNDPPVVMDQVITVCSNDPLIGFVLGEDEGSSDVATYNITGLNLNGLTISGGSPAIGTGLLASALADDSFTNTTNVPVDVIYTIVPVGENGQVGDSFTVTVTVNPEPVAFDQTFTVCSDSPLTGFVLGNDVDGPDVAAYNITGLNLNGLTVSAGGAKVEDGVLASGLADDAFTNITSTAVDVIYTVVPVSAGGCEGDPFTVTVTVNPEPVVVNQTFTACSDAPLGVNFNSSISVAAETYNVIALNLNGLSVSAGGAAVADGLTASALADDSFTNKTDAPIDIIYTVVPVSADGCKGDPFTVTVTVNPEPVVAHQAITACSDAPLVVNFNSSISVAAETYNVISLNLNGLTVSAGGAAVADGLTASAIADDSFTNETNAPIDIIYTVVPVSADGCKGDPFMVTVTVNPEPVVADQTFTVCSDSPLTGFVLGNDVDGPAVAAYNITGLNLNGLSVSAGGAAVADGLTASALADDSFTNKTDAPIDIIYTVVPVSADGCKGDPFTVTVKVNPEPIVADQTFTVCSDSPLTGFTLGNDLDGPASETYNVSSLNLNGLTVSAGGAVVEDGLLASALADDAFTNITSAAVDVIYTVVPVSADGCKGDPFTVTVTVNPEPVVADQSIIVESDAPLALDFGTSISVSAATYNITGLNLNGLTVSAGGAAVGSDLLASALADDAFTNRTNAPVDVIYTIVPVSATGCQGVPFTVTVTVNPGSITKNDIISSSGNSPVSGNVLTNDGDDLTVIGYTIADLDGPFTIGTLKTIPTIGTIILNADGSFTFTPVEDYSGTVPVITYTVSDGNGGTDTGDLGITVTAVNDAPVVMDQVIIVCSNDPLIGFVLGEDEGSSDVATYNITDLNLNGLTISGGSPAIGTGLLASALADDSFTNTTNVPVDVIYTIVPVGENGQVGDSFTVTVTVNPEPVALDQTFTVCSDSPLTGFVLGNDVDGPDVAAYNITGLNLNGLTVSAGGAKVEDGVLASGLADDAFTNITSTAVDVIYTVVPVSAGGCEGNPFTVTVTVNSESVVAHQAITACSDAPLGVNFNSSTSVAAATYNITELNLNGLTISGGAPAVEDGLLASALADDAFTNITSSAVNVIYTVVPVSALGCKGDPFTVTVTVIPEPVVADQSIIVESDAPLALDFGTSISVSAATYNITGLNLNGLTVSAGGAAVGSDLLASALADDAFTNRSNAPVDVIYTIVPVSATGCQGVPFTVTVTVNPGSITKNDIISSSGNSPVSGNVLTNDGDDLTVTGYTIADLDGPFTIGTLKTIPTIGTIILNADGSFTFTPVEDYSGTVPVITYTVSDGNGGTDTGDLVITITGVNDPPVVMDQIITVCSNDPLIGFVLGEDEGSSDVATYNITGLNLNGLTISGGSPAIGTGLLASALADDSFTNTTNVPVDVVYTIVPVGENGQVGDSFTVTVTVNPTPVIQNRAAIICSGDTFEVLPFNGEVGDIVPAGTTYTWIVKSANLGIEGATSSVVAGLTSISQTLTNNTNVVQNVVYTVTPTSGTCTGTTFEIEVTVNPKPEILDHSVEICSGEAFMVTPENLIGGDIAPSGTTYTWTVEENVNVSGVSFEMDPQTSISQSLINTSNVVQNVVYTVIPIFQGAGSCVGDPFTVTVTVYPEPVVADQSIIVESDAPLALDFGTSISVSAATYNITGLNLNGLTVSAGGAAVGSDLLASALADDAFTNRSNAPVDVIYTIVPVSATGCQGVPFTVTVTVNPGSITKNDIISSSGNSPVSGNVLTNDGDDLTVTGYTIADLDGPFTIGTLKTIPTIGTIILNADGNFTFTPVEDYSGTVPVITYTVSDGNGGTDTGDLVITVTAVNDPPVVMDQVITVCSNDPLIGFVLGEDEGSSDVATYNITDLILNGLTISGGSPAIGTGLLASALADDSFTNTTDVPVDVIYTIVPVGENGQVGDSFTVTVTVNPTPVIQNRAAIICSGDAFEFIPFNGEVGDIVPAGTTYTWIVKSADPGISGATSSFVAGLTSISETLTNNTNVVQKVVYTVTPTSGAAGACVGADFEIEVTVNPKPEILDHSVEICSGEAFMVTPENLIGGDIAPAGTTYTWTVNDNLDIQGDIDEMNPQTSISQSLINTSNVVQNVVYTVIPIFQGAGSCVGDPFTVTVTVNPEPVVADQSIIVESDAPLALDFGTSNSVSAATYNITGLNLNGLTVSAGGAAVGSDLLASALADDAFTNRTNAPVDVIYTIVPVSATGCQGVPFTVTVTVNPGSITKNDIISSSGNSPVSGNVLTNDIDGDDLTVTGYTIAGLDGLFTIGTVETIPNVGIIVINADGSFTFTPFLNYDGSVPVITYTVSDGIGRTDKGELVITVTASNKISVVKNDIVTSPADSPVSGNVLTNDIDGDDLTVTGYTIAGLDGPFTIGTVETIPNVGIIVINADGSFTFTPFLNYDGSVPVITYTVSDGIGRTDKGDLVITLIAVNEEPVDSDEDGVTNAQELLDGTDPNDGCEYESGSQDLTKVSASWKSLDCEDDGLTNDEELTGIDDPATPADPKGIKTDPRNPDSDGDGVMDGLDLCSIVSGSTTDGCPVQEYVNLGTINSIIIGNISENNELMSDAIYGTPVADSENPLGAELTMNSDGTYTFFARISGVYNFAVPACLPGQTSGCMMVPLQITVFEDLVAESPSVDLKITKFATADSWYEGDIVEYVIQVENLGTLDAKKLLVKDILPEGLGFVSSTVDGVLDVPNSREITWKFDSLVAGSSIEIFLKVKAFSLKDVKENRIVNIASVSSAEVDLTESDNTASAEILVKELFIPNVITPNGDGSNDRFEIKGLNKFLKTELAIFNRWGDHVFDQDNYQNDWSAEGLPTGTFFYVLVGIDETGERHEFKNWIQVIQD